MFELMENSMAFGFTITFKRETEYNKGTFKLIRRRQTSNAIGKTKGQTTVQKHNI